MVYRLRKKTTDKNLNDNMTQPEKYLNSTPRIRYCRTEENVWCCLIIENYTNDPPHIPNINEYPEEEAFILNKYNKTEF